MFLVNVYKLLNDDFHLKIKFDKTLYHQTSYFNDLYDDRKNGYIRSTPLSYEELSNYSWSPIDYITYINLCKKLYANNIYTSSTTATNLFTESSTSSKQSEQCEDIIFCITNIKRFLWRKGIHSSKNYYEYVGNSNENHLYSLFSVEFNIHYTEYININLLSDNLTNQSLYIRDFDNFRMTFERKLIRNYAGNNYCMMNYVDTHLKNTHKYNSFEQFIKYEEKNLTYDDIKQLHDRLTTAKNAHSLTHDALKTLINTPYSLKAPENITDTFTSLELEQNIIFTINHYIDILTPLLVSVSPTWRDDNTLYIYKHHTLCQTQKHNIISATAILTGRSNSQISLNVEYCTECQKFLMSYTTYERYRVKYGILLGNLQMEDSSSNNYNDILLADASPLKLCGYTVNQTENLSNADRQYIISKIIDKQILTKSEVIRYLEYFINLNGKKRGNEIALSKWKEDLDFTLQYKFDTQKKYNIDHLQKY